MPEDDLAIKVDMPPWDVVVEVAEAVEAESWVLAGGLMVQAHAMLAGRTSRATRDVDMLIDLMSVGASAEPGHLLER